MSRLDEIHGEMSAEWSRLLACWQTTREQWNDEVAESFEQRRWQEWEVQVPAYLRALQELENIADSAMRETQ
jgi:hypothetical protein